MKKLTGIRQKELEELLTGNEKYGDGRTFRKTREEEGELIRPLRQVPVASRGYGYVEQPLTAAELRSFMLNMPKWEDGPIAFVEALNAYLGISIYSPAELSSIIK